jgi:hypothetical protein
VHQARVDQLQAGEEGQLLLERADPAGAQRAGQQRPFEDGGPRVAVVEQVRRQQVAAGGDAVGDGRRHARRFLCVEEQVQDRRDVVHDGPVDREVVLPAQQVVVGSGDRRSSEVDGGR